MQTNNIIFFVAIMEYICQFAENLTTIVENLWLAVLNRNFAGIFVALLACIISIAQFVKTEIYICKDIKMPASLYSNTNKLSG